MSRSVPSLEASGPQIAYVLATYFPVPPILIGLITQATIGEEQNYEAPY